MFSVRKTLVYVPELLFSIKNISRPSIRLGVKFSRFSLVLMKLTIYYALVYW